PINGCGETGDRLGRIVIREPAHQYAGCRSPRDGAEWEGSNLGRVEHDVHARGAITCNRHVRLPIDIEVADFERGRVWLGGKCNTRLKRAVAVASEHTQSCRVVVAGNHVEFAVAVEIGNFRRAGAIAAVVNKWWRLKSAVTVAES